MFAHVKDVAREIKEGVFFAVKRSHSEDQI
jgi:hypothetical protein